MKEMKKFCLIILCIFSMNEAFPQFTSRHTIYEDTVLLNEVIHWALSWHFYAPVYIRCDSTSEPKLVLSTSQYLEHNYLKRNAISYKDFHELLVLAIKERKVLDDICIQDFEYLYGRDRPLPVTATIVNIPQSEKFMGFFNSMDLDSLMSWAFDSNGLYRDRGYSKLPMIAERLLQYGIVLWPNELFPVIGYYDVYQEIENKRQHGVIPPLK